MNTKLIESLGQIIQSLSEEENYTIEVPPRQDRSNFFAESLNEIPVWS